MTRRRWATRTAVTTVIALCALVATGLPATAQPADPVPEGGDAGLSAAAQATAERAEAHGVTLERAVLEQLDERPTTDFWVVLPEPADLSGAAEVAGWAERGEFVHRRLVETAQTSQAELLTRLRQAGADVEPYWITNAVLVRGGDWNLLDLAIGTSPREIRATQTYQVPEPVAAEPAAEPAAVTWGIADIGADRVWAELGVRGEGIVVGSIDTGVEYTHPALVGRYRGNRGDGSFDHHYNWWDPTGVCGPAPCDNNRHGTHTVGTMVGDDGAGNQIGVAPGARWIAAKGCEGQGCSDSALVSSGQFMLAPTDLAGQNPRTDLRPHVVNNSWGEPNFEAESQFYRDIIDAWTAAGIFSVFSNGNEGDDRPAPACDTTGSPADYQHAWGVGAYGETRQIAPFSSRGPGEDGVVKPNLAAPGVAVRSSVPDGGYANLSGTSMAAPHQSGAVALIWSAAPSLAGEVAETRELLAGTAVDTENVACGGTAALNNVWGEGRLDAFAAVAQAPRGPAGTLVGTVRDAASGAGLAGATITATGADTFTTVTRADGSYQRRLPVGTYAVAAEAGNHLGQSVPGVAIREGEATTQDFALEPIPVMTVTPEALTSWQRPEETVSQLLTIGNDGAAELAWRVVPDGSACDAAGTPPWVTVQPASGAVAPGDRQAVTVAFDSTGLAIGELAGAICLAGNDPDRPAVTVPLTLLVDDAPPADWVQRDKFVPSDRTDRIDGFGEQVDVSGDTAVALACTASDGSSAYVYTRTDGVWRETAKLTPSSPAGCGGLIPGSVAIDGDTVVLGLPVAPDDEGNPTFNGRVTAFVRAGGEWTEQAVLAGLAYGFGVALDGDTLITSAAPDDGDLACPCPPHVFHRDGDTWSKQGELMFPENVALTTFGGLALDGTTALVGGVELAGAPAGERRAAVFSRTGEDWAFEAVLAPSDGAPDLDFARNDVSLDGDTAVVTAGRAGNSEGRPLAQSAAYVFTRGGDGWHEQQKLLPLQPDDANWRSVAVDGDRILVGADSAGKVHVWNRVGDRWQQHATLSAADPDRRRFGREVALDAAVAIISATPNQISLPPFFPAENGPIYVFDTGEPAPTLGPAPRAADFGGVTVETISDVTRVRLENNGSADLRLGRLGLAGDHSGDFLLTGDDCSEQVVTPGQACAFELSFRPGRGSLGERTAQVEIPSNAVTTPDRIPVSGEGLPAPPGIAVSPDRLVTELAEGSRRTEPVLISNRGTLDLTWSAFPDQAEALMLQAPDDATVAAAPEIDLTGADLARLTTGPPAAPTPAPSHVATTPGTVTLSQSRSLEVRPENTARCGGSDGTTNPNQFLRTFTLADFGIGGDLAISEVAFGVENLTVPADLTVNLYLLVGDFTYANLLRLATTTVHLQPQAGTVVTVPISTIVPAGTTLVMEVVAPDLAGAGNFSAGSNGAGESAPSYLATATCGVAEPTPYARLGFPDTHLVMTVSGTTDCGSEWLSVAPDGGTVAGDRSQLVEVTVDAAGLPPGEQTANLCLASNDPRRPLTVVPVTVGVSEREPVTFDDLRHRVVAFEDEGAVTKAGARRLLRTLDRAEYLHDRGVTGKAIKALEDFQRAASNPKWVLSPAARDALVADAALLIAQLREQIENADAAAPVAGQHVRS